MSYYIYLIKLIMLVPTNFIIKTIKMIFLEVIVLMKILDFFGVVLN